MTYADLEKIFKSQLRNGQVHFILEHDGQCMRDHASVSNLGNIAFMLKAYKYVGIKDGLPHFVRLPGAGGGWW